MYGKLEKLTGPTRQDSVENRDKVYWTFIGKMHNLAVSFQRSSSGAVSL